MKDEKQRVIALYEFIKEFSKLKTKSTLNYQAYPFKCELNKFKSDREELYIADTVNYSSNNDSDNSKNDVIFYIQRPDFEACPEPNENLLKWIKSGWQDYRLDADRYEYLEYKSEQGEEKEIFVENENRVLAFNKWLEQREAWKQRQIETKMLRDLFAIFYNLYLNIEKDPENLELVIGNGIFRDKYNDDINHPLVLKVVNLVFDSENEIISVVDSFKLTEFYSEVFNGINEANNNAVSIAYEEISSRFYHPYCKEHMESFLNRFMNEFSHNSAFFSNGVPDVIHSRFYVFLNPVLFLRKKADGTIKTIEEIIDDIKNGAEIPSSVIDITKGGIREEIDDDQEVSIEKVLAATSGESPDVFFAKEANKEQLEIAKKMEKYNAVLVQGPPGTGKTHTIANLLCHFLAQGKSVLVTSHTSKALAVLKDKIPQGLRDLCVAVLKDSNKDLESTVHGILEHFSNDNIRGIREDLQEINNERLRIIEEQNILRNKIFLVKNKEYENIVLNGDGYSLIDAAQFVYENKDNLDIIPGSIKPYCNIPFSIDKLRQLYKTNGLISDSDEQELEFNLPKKEMLWDADVLEHCWKNIDKAQAVVKSICQQEKWLITNICENSFVIISGNNKITVPFNCIRNIIEINNECSSIAKIEPWMQRVIIDGKNGGGYAEQWNLLIELIKKTNEYAKKIAADISSSKVVFCGENPEQYLPQYYELEQDFLKNGKIPWSKKFSLFGKNMYVSALKSVNINSHCISSAQDCRIVIEVLSLEQMREDLSRIWNSLFPKLGVFSLNAKQEVELKVANWTNVIEKYLNWYQETYLPIRNKINSILAVDIESFFGIGYIDTDDDALNKKLYGLSHTINQLTRISVAISDSITLKNKLRDYRNVFLDAYCENAVSCKKMLAAIDAQNLPSYQNAFFELIRLIEKWEVLDFRRDCLKLLSEVAPDWAEAIRTRDGIHGQSDLPNCIIDAWKWKQLHEMVNGITSVSMQNMLERSVSLSKRYRELTADFAEKSAWYHLLNSTKGNISLQQALNGWLQTVRRIGKGTGKRVNTFRAEAMKLMSKCQEAVPVWIMPVQKVLEQFDPAETKFDVVIVDEASQCDLTALTLLYYGKKIIIVGDDKQVSPMSIGTEANKVNQLINTYLKDVVNNHHLYTEQSSLYDIAMTTFQPLMLKEHFRCVPDIIGFSNWLSYDGKIKPLRDVSDCKLLPFTISYRVDGRRDERKKTNISEQKAIISLIKACMEREEYRNKTFGVITLLGDEQADAIQSNLANHISPAMLLKHKVLCGNASNFQGDERDVIFLSMVDSNDSEGPLRAINDGVNDAIKKRYNVAVSRARDQLWVVHSLDRNNDLKSSDIRKRLLDYISGPKAYIGKDEFIAKKADSPFEVSVAKKLIAEGYNIVQQWEVGSYRIDMVAVCGNKKIAIECDGERYHRGEKKIAQDMERQTILERIGWKFIRIRGSEYYSNPVDTMNSVMQKLSAFGIEPETNITHTHDNETLLLEEIKIRAAEILNNWDADRPELVRKRKASSLLLEKKQLTEDPLSNTEVEEDSSLEKKDETISIVNTDSDEDDDINNVTSSVDGVTGDTIVPEELFENSKIGIWVQLSIFSKLTDKEKTIAAQIYKDLKGRHLRDSLKLEAIAVLESAIKKGFVVSDSIKKLLGKNGKVNLDVLIDKSMESDVKHKKSNTNNRKKQKEVHNNNIEQLNLFGDNGVEEIASELKKENLEVCLVGDEIWVLGEVNLAIKLGKYKNFKFRREGCEATGFRPSWVMHL